MPRTVFVAGGLLNFYLFIYFFFGGGGVGVKLSFTQLTSDAGVYLSTLARWSTMATAMPSVLSNVYRYSQSVWVTKWRM